MDPEIYGKVVFYFNKIGMIEKPYLDQHAFDRKIEERRKVLKERFRMFGNFAQKEIDRKNSLEALENYRTIVIASLVEALRIKYHPSHCDFKMRYIHYELPPRLVRKLENLCFVIGREDLQRKYLEAVRWFNSLITNPTTFEFRLSRKPL